MTHLCLNCHKPVGKPQGSVQEQEALADKWPQVGCSRQASAAFSGEKRKGDMNKQLILAWKK